MRLRRQLGFGLIAVLSVATLGAAQKEAQDRQPPRGRSEAEPDARMLADMEILRDLELLQQLDLLRKMDEVRTEPPPHGARTDARGKP